MRRRARTSFAAASSPEAAYSFCVRAPRAERAGNVPFVAAKMLEMFMGSLNAPRESGRPGSMRRGRSARISGNLTRPREIKVRARLKCRLWRT